MQSIVCGAPCVSVSLTKPNKQTNKPSQSLPPPNSPQGNKQTDSAAVSLFSTFCISVSYFHIFAGCLSIVLRQIPLPLPVVCILTGRQAVKTVPAPTDCLPAYPFDTFSHLSSRLLLALIAFPSASSLGCLAAFWLPHLLCRLWLLHCFAREPVLMPF